MARPVDTVQSEWSTLKAHE